MPPKHSADSFGESNTSSTPVQLGDNSHAEGIVSSARGRSDGFDIGADRAITNPPNWESAPTSQDLWNQANLGNDPSTATSISQSWSSHGTQLNQASNDLYTAISELGAAWIGQGAASAQGSLVAIANSGSQASEAATTMSDRLQKQADAATKVKLMPKPTNYTPEGAMGQALAAGPVGMITDQKPLADQDKEVRAEQARFLEAYTKEMSEVDSSTPSFGPESLGMKPTASHNSASFSGVGNVGGGGLDSGAVSGAPVLAGTHGYGGAQGGSPAPVVHAGPDSGVFSQAGYNPATGNLPASGVAPGAGVASGAGAPIAPHAPAASGGNGLGQALTAAALGGGLGYAGAKALGQGNKSGAKDTDGTGAAATDNAPAQSAASQAVPQQGLVSSSGTIGGGATPPMQGMGGGMGMGAHGAQAEQEEEHTHASFLIEPDPDDAFGANEATPPPVIGAWTEDDDR
ncbi:WXG100 family type VII secretion target [Amycolatopsis sp. cmx-11-51]|uniref:WXG100 family type VII secretion target n=1 Tax=unclassified Amycolatopsis TaxID=2618356 RepID=UPI0039E29910